MAIDAGVARVDSPRVGSEAAFGQYSSGESKGLSYMRYTILQRPPWMETILLGFQQFLTMIGSTVLMPFIINGAMGGTTQELALLINTSFFISGIMTLVNITVGDRLPIIHGCSFAFITPVLAIASFIKATGQFSSDQERFLETMRVLQGGVIGSGLIVAAAALSGLISPLLAIISPITVAANIGVLGLGLYSAGMPGMIQCPHLGLTLMALVIIFSQYLRGIAIQMPSGARFRPFELFPVVLSILVGWLIAFLLTVGGAYKDASPEVLHSCSTNEASILQYSPWFRVPYPGQWGTPKVTLAGTFTILAGALTATVESLGDYFAAAKIVGAPVPPPGLIRRAVVWQGFSIVLAGLWGTGSGTTAYNENIGAMQITRVGSRRVIQVAAVWMMFCGLVGKVGGFFASMPEAMLSGLFCVVFGIIVAVGLSQMELTNQNSPRNIFVLGFALYMGLSVPDYMSKAVEANGGITPINSGSSTFDDVMTVILSTPAAVALGITLFFDNTIPGTAKERGLGAWQKMDDQSNWWEDDHMNQVYGLPFDLTRKYQRHVGQPIRDWFWGHVGQPLSRFFAPLGCTLKQLMCCWSFCGLQPGVGSEEGSSHAGRVMALGGAVGMLQGRDSDPESSAGGSTRAQGPVKVSQASGGIILAEMEDLKGGGDAARALPV